MRDFMIVVFCVFVLVAFYALWQGKLNAFGLGVVILALACATFVLYSVGAPAKFGAKVPGGEILAEVKEIREEVFAKAETVKKIGEETAELATFAALSVGRFAAGDLQAQLLRSRDRVVSILRQIGADPERIRIISERYTDRVRADLLNRVRDAAMKSVVNSINRKQAVDQGVSFDRNAIYLEITQRLERYRGTEQEHADFLTYIDGQGGSGQEVIATLDEMDYFLKTGQIKVVEPR